MSEKAPLLTALRKYLLRFLLSAGFISYVAATADWQRLRNTFWDIRLLPFAASYCVFLVNVVFAALRLRALMEPTVLRLSVPRLVEIQFISQFFGLMLPTGIGLMAARWYKVTRNRLGRRVFVVITVIERVMYLGTLLICIGLPILLVRDPRIAAVRGAALTPIGVVLGVCAVFFLCILEPNAYRAFASLGAWVQGRFRGETVKKLLGFYEDCGMYLERRGVFGRAFLYHLCFQALMFLRMYLAFVALDVRLPLATILWMTMLVLLVLALPISLGGLGVRESGFAWLVALYGVEPERGMLLGGILSAQLLVNAVVGAVLNITESRGHTSGQSETPAPGADTGAGTTGTEPTAQDPQ